MQVAASKHQKNHYAGLDGLRGFAALSVLVYHLGHWFNVPGLATNSGLAVDLFFCLSGYVLPLAYQRHRDRLDLGAFMRVRLVRLMPLIALAIAVSATYVVLRELRTEAGVPYRDVARAVVQGLFNLPYFGAPKSIGGPEIFPLNGPQYTLFLELVVNALWWGTRGVNQVRLSLALMTVGFTVLMWTGLGGDLPDTFWSGFPRVIASFFAGVALFHLEGRIPVWRGTTALFWVLAAVMAVLFYMPFEAPRALELAWVAALSPLLVLTGARARFSDPMSAIGRFSGEMSYPVYCLHYPLFSWINGLYRARFGPQNLLIEGPIVIAVVLILSVVILKLYDEPLRRALVGRTPRRTSGQVAACG